MSRRGSMSDDDRALFMCLIFPPFWPLAMAILIQRAIEAIRGKISRWRKR